jgi:hypothetical protein
MISVMPELAFLLSDGSTAQVVDLASALAEEVDQQDAATLLCSDAPPPPSGDRVYVILCGDGEVEREATCPALSRAIVVLLAPPGSDGFSRGVELARRAGAVFHVNSVATERLLELGLPARHLQLGYSADWGGFEPGATRTVPIVGADDLDLLPRAQLAIVHDRRGYLDWLLLLGAIHRGAVVLHEQALGLAPLVAGRHLFVASPEAMDTMAAALLGDPARLDEVRVEALSFVRDALPLALAAAALVGMARTLVAQPLVAAIDSTPGQQASRSK